MMLIAMKNSSSSKKSPTNILLLLPKLFLIIAIVLLMWIVIVVSGVSVLDFDPDWAGLSLSSWLLVISALFAAFIIIDIMMYVTPSLFVKGTIQEFTEESTVEHLDGMKVYEYTHPKNKTGGIFSKTYIKINEDTLIRVRNQMISAEILWPEKSNEEKEE
jgi:hypothetical protein